MNLRLRNGMLPAAMLAVACAASSGSSVAATIVAPIDAFATSTFSSSNRNNYFIINTINQSGLSLRYVSGVTDFDSYLASRPQHTSNANRNEWFSRDFSQASPNRSSQNARQSKQSGDARGNVTKTNALQKNQQVSNSRSVKAKHSAGRVNKNQITPQSSAVSASSTSAITSSPLASIIYEFSALTSINGFVLWNEEYAGIGTTQLWSSTDGDNYTLLSTIKPNPSTFAPAGEIVPYLAQVFSFDPTIMLFFKLMVYDCPKPSANKDSYRGCGIGEVAFSSVPPDPNQGNVVPVPAALPLFASALGIFAWLGRRRKSHS